MSTNELVRVLDQLGHPLIMVLGDLILDRYTWGNAERISQEAPVIVLRADKRDARLGGAANVANMLRGLEARVTCCGVVGDDEAGRELRLLLDQAGACSDLVLAEKTRPTTVKERFVGLAGTRHPNQILRVDHEVHSALEGETEEQLSAEIHHRIGAHDMLLISDYGKGVCTTGLMQAAIRSARTQGVPVLVDPSRYGDYEGYRGATIVKPNRVETEAATGMQIRSANDAIAAGKKLCNKYDFAMALITLDSDGMVLVHRDGQGEMFPTYARKVYDITGAGDMVLAMMGACLGAGTTPQAAVQLSNVAAGIEVERAGVAIVSKSEIRAELQTSRQPGARKVITLEAAHEMAEQYRRQGRSIVFTNGCFDLLHVGHVTNLAEAASLGDVLFVGVNSDASVRRLKGPTRPVIKEGDRAALLGALACVGHVVVFDDDTPHALLHAIRPDVLVKGGTYTTEQVVGHEIVESYGGRVCVTGVVDGVSTTRILQSLQDGAPLTAVGGNFRIDGAHDAEPASGAVLRRAG
jgi:D-beta-D-heptose 7-phosphate kinase / D-beta-D-heptose 1-phosphate adenosyltransferase